jgi:hypothetical protein
MALPLMIDKDEIERMYSLLPQDSKAKFAENPEWFKWYLKPVNYHIWAFPHISLCETESKKIMWQLLDFDQSIDLELRIHGKEFIDRQASKRAKETLNAIELVSRYRHNEYAHRFLGEGKIDTTKYIPFTDTFSK